MATTPVAALEARASRLAATQHGALTRAQLLAIGFSSRMIERRIESGWLRVLQRGVYALGPVLAPGGHELAAVLACGPHAFVSHQTAAARHDLPLPAQPRSIHITVVGRHPRRRPGITIHRVGSLGTDERQIKDRVPLTTPARVALDLSPMLAPFDLERLLAEAQGRNASTLDQVRTLLDRYPRRPGTGKLRTLLHGGGPARTRSNPERRLLALIRKARLPPPETNAKIGPWEVDFVWPRHRVVVEVDSQPWHASRPARERDARKDQELVLRGYVVIRVTDTQLDREPETVVARIAAALARRGDALASGPYPVASS